MQGAMGQNTQELKLKRAFAVGAGIIPHAWNAYEDFSNEFLAVLIFLLRIIEGDDIGKGIVLQKLLVDFQHCLICSTVENDLPYAMSLLLCKFLQPDLD